MAERAALDVWLRDIAPSASLRKWFNHDPRRYRDFRTRYREELGAHSDTLEALRLRASSGRVTLLYAARDARINHAVVLREMLVE